MIFPSDKPRALAQRECAFARAFVELSFGESPGGRKRRCHALDGHARRRRECTASSATSRTPGLLCRWSSRPLATSSTATPEGEPRGVLPAKRPRRRSSRTARSRTSPAAGFRETPKAAAVENTTADERRARRFAPGTPRSRPPRRRSTRAGRGHDEATDQRVAAGLRDQRRVVCRREGMPILRAARERRRFPSVSVAFGPPCTACRDATSRCRHRRHRPARSPLASVAFFPLQPPHPPRDRAPPRRSAARPRRRRRGRARAGLSRSSLPSPHSTTRARVRSTTSRRFCTRLASMTCGCLFDRKGGSARVSPPASPSGKRLRVSGRFGPGRGNEPSVVCRQIRIGRRCCS